MIIYFESSGQFKRDCPDLLLLKLLCSDMVDA